MTEIGMTNCISEYKRLFEQIEALPPAVSPLFDTHKLDDLSLLKEERNKLFALEELDDVTDKLREFFSSFSWIYSTESKLFSRVGAIFAILTVVGMMNNEGWPLYSLFITLLIAVLVFIVPTTLEKYVTPLYGIDIDDRFTYAFIPFLKVLSEEIPSQEVLNLSMDFTGYDAPEKLVECKQIAPWAKEEFFEDTPLTFTANLGGGYTLSGQLVERVRRKGQKRLKIKAITTLTLTLTAPAGTPINDNSTEEFTVKIKEGKLIKVLQKSKLTSREPRNVSHRFLIDSLRTMLMRVSNG